MWGISQVDNNAQINAYKIQNGITNPCAGNEGGGVNAFNVITEDQNFWGYPTYCIVCPDKKINFNICFPPEVACFDPYFESCYPPPIAEFSADITTPVIGETVSFTDLSTGNPTSWLWTISPPAITFVGGTSLTSQNPQVQFNLSGSYSVELMIANATSSDTEIKTNYINTSFYCSASGSSNLLHISKVMIGDIDNSSEQDYYTDYTYMSTDLSLGQNDVGITVENGNPYGNDDLGVWIDWNQDGDFSGSGENIVCEINDQGQGTFLFDVPENAFLGNTTMRIRIKYSGSDCGNPCGTTTYGEVEDYSVNILNPGIDINITVFLEGPFNGTDMNTDLNGNPELVEGLPFTQPYNTSPWYYTGTESVLSIPGPDIVDWILVELRDATSVDQATGSTIIAQQAAFIKNDGQLIDTNGNPVINFPALSVSDSLYVVIYQRNHISVISGMALLEATGIYNYDFSSSESQAFGGINGHKEIAPGIWGMRSGDGDANGTINQTDKDNIWFYEAGSRGYLQGDYNMGTDVDNKDKNDKCLPNLGKGTSVPE